MLSGREMQPPETGHRNDNVPLAQLILNSYCGGMTLRSSFCNTDGPSGVLEKSEERRIEPGARFHIVPGDFVKREELNE